MGASSSDVTYPAYNATDGNPETRWAVDRTLRSRQDSWIAVDLGSEVTVAGVRLLWEAAYGTRYLIQTSLDAVNWTDVASVPRAHELSGGWVDIEGRAGLITYGSDRPITVSATGVIAATGEASATTIEGYPGRRADLPALARRRVPAAPAGMRVSDADGYLSVFNLTPDTITGATVTIPSLTRLYLGVQVVRSDGLAWTVTQPGGTARVEPPRFTLDGPAPLDTRFVVTDSHHVTVVAPAGNPARVTLHAGHWSATVRVPAGGFPLGEHARRPGHPDGRPGPRPHHLPDLTAADRHDLTVRRGGRQPRRRAGAPARPAGWWSTWARCPR